MTASPFFESRFPVGSSASRIDGAPADRAGDGDALLLTAGELAGQVLGAVRHADLLERRHHALLALGRLHAAIGERQLDVLVDVEIADQVEALEDEPDLAVADARALRERQIGDRLAVERVLALGRRVEQPEDRQERRLAAARRPGDRDVLAALDLEVDAGEGVRLHLVGEEHLRDAIEVDESLRGSVHHRSLVASVSLSFQLLGSSARGALVQLHAVELVVRRHVGEDDPIPGLQALSDLDRAHRASAEHHLRAVRLAVGVSLKSVIVLSSWPNAGRPTKITSSSFSRRTVPSTLRSGRAPGGSAPSSDDVDADGAVGRRGIDAR